MPLASGGEDPFLWDLLEAAPTSQKARRLTLGRIESLLRKHRIRRFDAQKVLAVLRGPMLPLTKATIDSLSFATAMLLPRIRLLSKQRKVCEENLHALLESIKHPVDSTTNENESIADAAILEVLPGVGPLVLANMLGEASRAIGQRDRQVLRIYASLAPVTK